MYQIALVIFLLATFLVLIIALYPSRVLTLKKERIIVNGKPRIFYIIERQDLIVPVNKINFTESFYREALLNRKIEDLNIVILIDWVKLHSRLLLIPLKKWLFLEIDYVEIEANLRNIKEAKVLLYSGRTLVGETTIKVKIY